MTTIMPIDEPVARGTINGRQVTSPPLSEAEHIRRRPLRNTKSIASPGARWGPAASSLMC